MAERILCEGNEAVARGAIQAGCKAFFGYPITPQSEIMEYISREVPKVGGVFLQAECEVAAINMVLGGALAGARTMTSTASPGFGLMQEGISHTAYVDLPAVLVDMVRMGPSSGSGGQQGQSDYRQATRGAFGGAHPIVLAPATIQEHFDLIQLAFHLADRYRILVIVLSDFIGARMAEPLELKTLDFGPVPEKDWALEGRGQHKGGQRNIGVTYLASPEGLTGMWQHIVDKERRIMDGEIRYDSYGDEDAGLLLVAYGSMSRVAQGAIDMARAEGLKVCLLRPITLWPFPSEAVREAGLRAGKVLVVEDCQGQLVEDVQTAVRWQVPVHLLGLWARHLPSPSGLIHPERVLEEVKRLL